MCIHEKMRRSTYHTMNNLHFYRHFMKSLRVSVSQHKYIVLCVSFLFFVVVVFSSLSFGSRRLVHYYIHNVSINCWPFGIQHGSLCISSNTVANRYARIMNMTAKKKTIFLETLYTATNTHTL